MNNTIYVGKSCHGTTNVYTTCTDNERLRQFLLTFSAWCDKAMMHTDFMTESCEKLDCYYTEAVKGFYSLASEEWFRECVRIQFGCNIIIME